MDWSVREPGIVSHQNSDGARLVHRHIRAGHLSSQLVHCLLNAEDWSSVRFRFRWVTARGDRWWLFTNIPSRFNYFSRWSRRPQLADTKQRGIPAVHSAATRVQVLVRNHQVHHHSYHLHVLRCFQCPGLLADPCHVLHNAFLHHNEAAD